MPKMRAPKGITVGDAQNDVMGVGGPLGMAAEKGGLWLTQAIKRLGLPNDMQEMMKYLPLREVGAPKPPHLGASSDAMSELLASLKESIAASIKGMNPK